VRDAEDVERLGEAEDAPQERDLFFPRPARLPVAIPVLVQGVDGRRSRLREAELPRDVGTALATRWKMSVCVPCFSPSRTSAAARANGEPAGATVRAAQSRFSVRFDQSTVFTALFRRRSSLRKSEQIFAAFDEQPASLSRRA